MSTIDPPPPPPPAAPPQRSGCLTALMAVLGVIMLLPGLCALLFGGMSLVEGGKIDSDVAPLVSLGLLIAIGGAALIGLAIKGRKAPTDPATRP
ncbi:hypothetical protein XH98_18180 [Bradyrhizobium sp. CCBAU 51745]|uniref:hypothetical protein n=1 Tax=Bradyrhizobium sp. CCBAU 51745 TaxID=1325099 RepID=UPI002304D4F8|nr:hypothetical protein [Bradyrhizobium sp. CCBAU 51745]MDA9440983.1 hypothetical protein [Bradyrhizobium sp. CCBAU 51745]